MTAQDFLKKVLRKWNELFEGINLKYAYDAVTEYHIVEVSPEEIRRGSAEYKKTEMRLWMEFMDQYPSESLLICAPSDANDMSNLLFTNDFVGDFYAQEEVSSNSFAFTLDDYCRVYAFDMEKYFGDNNYALAA